MCKLCQRDSNNSREVDKSIIELIHKIRDKFHPEKIILFGSRARGDNRKSSDVDILIVGDFKERYFDRVGKILEMNDTKYDLQPWIYSYEEFSRMENNFFLRSILKEGINLV
ncbi:MAG: nucleotidyltransferase domain-containing protein [Elusimicrobiota bacterium]